MRAIWTITRRELQSFFDSLIAYMLLILFLGFCGYFTWLFGVDVFLRNEASMQSFFEMAFWALLIFIPAITMRLLAEENKTGTIEILLTKAITDWQVVFGKFLAALLLIVIALACTLPYYFTIWSLGPVDHGAVWCGYLGLTLMSAAYISIGMVASSVTNNQIVAFLMGLLIALFFHIFFPTLSSYSTGFFADLFNSMGMRTHYDSIVRGVVDTRDIIYFLSIVLLGLVISENVLAKRNITD